MQIRNHSPLTFSKPRSRNWRRVVVAGRAMHLTPKEYGALTYERLLERVRGAVAAWTRRRGSCESNQRGGYLYDAPSAGGGIENRLRRRSPRFGMEELGGRVHAASTPRETHRGWRQRSAGR